MSKTPYQHTLDYLYSKLPMYQRVGRGAFKKDLTNILALCGALGNPHQQFESIHIAGTNGKGTTAHGIAAILQSKGLKVGLYTSPHYRDFRERIKINAQYIPEAQVVSQVEKLKPLIESIEPSFFEITVALAFAHFATEKVDIAIIETGLGGRLDSTNIINPLLSVITNISLDHQTFLGDTLPAIAGEKAGIIKPNTPVLIGECPDDAVRKVFIEKAASENAPIYFAEEIFQCRSISDQWSIAEYELSNEEESLQFQSDLTGPYQSKNINTILASIQTLSGMKGYEYLRDLKANFQGLESVKESTKYLGRWHILGEAPIILADSAHNEASIESVLKRLSDYEPSRLHFVLGVVADKELDKTLKRFPRGAAYYFCKPDIIRGMDATQLQALARKVGLNGRVYNSVNEALNAAKQKTIDTDLIYVGGSTFVVAEVV